MAFDATTPYALACLSDGAKSVQSLTVLRQQEAPEVRVRNLVDLAKTWNVVMGREEAERVVAEFDLVLRLAPGASNLLGGSFDEQNGFSSASRGS